MGFVQTEVSSSERLAAIVDRYFLQSMARRMVLDRSLLGVKETCDLDLGKLPRVVHCCRTLTGGWSWDEAVHVVAKGEGERLRFDYAGLQTCGSWSACPICAQKIANKRGKQILSAVKKWDKGSIVMLTLTAPHFKGESLSEVRLRFMQARRLFRQQKTVRRDNNFQPFSSLRRQYQIKGAISALEVTYSDANGWHFHSHELLFSGQDLCKQDLVNFDVRCKLAWLRACERSKIVVADKFSFFTHGCKVSLTDRKSASYLSKFGSWTAADELTQSHYKRGRLKSLTPWDFLRLAGESAQSYHKYGLLFVEVVKTFFGKQQIFFEKGFKKFLGFDSLTDQEIAESGLEIVDSEIFGILSYWLWRKVCVADLRGYILAECVAGKSWLQIQNSLGVRFAAVKG